MKILIAEDEKVSAVLLKKMMTRWGTPDVVTDGQAAFELYKRAYHAREKYDVIFLDIMMPGWTGHQVLEKIREFEIANGIGGKDMIPIIMTTLCADEKNVMRAFLKGVCDGYVIKPITLEKIKNEMLRLQLID